jgi:hypothetical protein
MKISITAKFYCFMDIRILTADIQCCHIRSIWGGGGGTSCLRSGVTSALIEMQSFLYANFEANKMSLHQ